MDERHSKSDGGERKILGSVDIIEHLYHNQGYLSHDSRYERKILFPFLKSLLLGLLTAKLTSTGELQSFNPTALLAFISI